MTIRLLAEKATRWLCILLPWATFGYGVRLAIGPLPTTGLELVLFGVFGLFTLARGWAGWQDAWRALPSRWLLVAWIMVGFVAALYSPAMIKGLGLWRAFLLEPVLALAIVNVVLTTKQDRDQLRMSLWTSVVFVSVWALIEFVTGWGIQQPWNVSIAEGRRATGPYGFPNAVALFAAPIVAYAGAWAMKERDRLALALAVLGFAGMVAVRSDGGMLAALVAWGMALLAFAWGRWVVGAGTVAIGSLLALLPALREVVWKELTFQGWSGKVRLIMWGETWEMLKANWVLGAGMAGYPLVFDAFHKKRFIEIFQYPHQLVYNAWSEVGIIGLVLFLGLLLTWALRAYRSSTDWRHRVIGLAPLVAVIVHGLVDVPYWKNDLAVIFFLLWWLAGERKTRSTVSEL